MCVLAHKVLGAVAGRAESIVNALLFITIISLLGRRSTRVLRMTINGRIPLAGPAENGYWKISERQVSDRNRKFLSRVAAIYK